MNRQTLQFLVLAAGLCALAGCSDDPMDAPSADSFAGDWVVLASAAQKMPCELGALDETQLLELHIDQHGQEVVLDLDGIELRGEVRDRTLTAIGESASGASVEISLELAGATLGGELQLSSSCTESRSVIARRRVPDANFAGHWEFDLRVVGSGGCDHITDYHDCFRIFQTGSDLLVVDDLGGNLHGRVLGDVARIERDTDAEITTLIFYLDVGKQEMSGEALREFSVEDCRTDLEFVARRSSIPCAEHQY